MGKPELEDAYRDEFTAAGAQINREYDQAVAGLPKDLREPKDRAIYRLAVLRQAHDYKLLEDGWDALTKGDDE